MRDAFDIPRDVAWLNAAQMSAMHQDLVEAGRMGVMRKRAPWDSPPPSFFSEVETARGLFARLIGAAPDDVALAPSASYGIATAAKNLAIGPGRKALVVEAQFPSNVYAWRRRAAETGGSVETVARAPDGAITEPLLAAIDETTAIVACARAHWSDATPVDLKAISARAKAVGAALVLDLTQSLGAEPFDVAEIDPDFMVCPMYKWMLGPYSTGFLYVAPRRQDGAPLEETWMNRKDAVDFSALVAYTDAYADGARRFDVGEKSNFALMPMVVAALKLIEAWRPERLAAALATINARLAAALAARGFAPPPEALRSPHFFGVRLPARAPDDLLERLRAERVYVSVRGDKMRISPHLWIDAEDEARFLAALDRHLG